MEKEKQFEKLFVGGDLSGIQKFLYNISSSKAAVSLIGRSDFLREYMDNVCNAVAEAARAAGASETKIIYHSGGKFYLLTENSENVVKAIQDYAHSTKEKLWKSQSGQLNISISYVPFTEHADGTVDVSEGKSQKPGILWSIVNNDFARQKRQKFKHILEENYASFFDPITVSRNDKACAVTGIEFSNCVPVDDKEKNETIYVLPSVKEQVLRGEDIRREKNFKTFEEYAGDCYLGILRMDVDGLGERFIKGFSSIAEYQTFSERLVKFFEKDVIHIQEEPAYKEFLNIIYAGGDDLFVVGRWDKVIDFAERINKETSNRFAADNITISGGIAIVKPKYPLAKAAELAGEAEHTAKQFNNGKKNAFHMLGRTVSWVDEFDYVKRYKDLFLSQVHNDSSTPLSKSVLHKLMLYAALADMNKEYEKKGEKKNFSYVWHLNYYLTRQMEKYKKKNGEAFELCRTLRDKELSANQNRNLELIAIAARWAELTLKEIKTI